MRGSTFLLFAALILNGCGTVRHLQPVTSIAEEYKSAPATPPVEDITQPAEQEVDVSTVTSTAKAVKKRKTPAARLSACDPALWRKVTHKPYPVPERFVYKVQWGPVTAGQAVLALSSVETIRGRAAYKISMDIRSTGLTEKMYAYVDHSDSWLDRDALVTVLAYKSVRQKKYAMDETMVFDPPCQRVTHMRKRLDKEARETRRIALSTGTLDMFSALYYLRTQPLEVGTKIQFPLYAGQKIIPVIAWVKKIDKISISRGTFSCFLIEMSSQDPAARNQVKRTEWWISADEKRWPIRIRMDIKLGSIVAELLPERR